MGKKIEHTTEGEKIAKKNLNSSELLQAASIEMRLVTEEIIINFHLINISAHKVVTREGHDRPLIAADRRTRHTRDRNSNSNSNSDLDSHGDGHNDAFPMAPDTADSFNGHVPCRSSR